MEFRDLKRQYQALKEKIDEGIREVIQSASFISGRQVEELEGRLASYVGVKHCVACGNGTDALNMALMAWGVGPGDCAFVPDFTFFASGEAVSYRGAVPVFVDVDKRTYNMDPDKLERAILRVLEEKRLVPRVIVTVDLFGLPADYGRIRKIADKYGLLILEDAAQGFGGEWNGRKACSFGDISTTSFFPAKPLGCYGDGGAVFTDSDEIDGYLRSLRVHGKGQDKYDNVRIGVNSRLDTVQAAVLLVKLQAFTAYELADVNEAARNYSERLEGLVEIPYIPDGYVSSWAQYCIRLETEKARDGLQEFLKGRGIPTMIYYPKPMHAQKAFSGISGAEGELENSSELCRTVLELPIHPYLREEDVEYVAEQIKTWREKNDR